MTEERVRDRLTLLRRECEERTLLRRECVQIQFGNCEKPGLRSI